MAYFPRAATRHTMSGVGGTRRFVIAKSQCTQFPTAERFSATVNLPAATAWHVLIIFARLYAGGMTREPPHPDDLPFIRLAVAEYRRLRPRGYDEPSAQELALQHYWNLRPDEDAHEARRKVMDAIRWAKQEFSDWMAGKS